MELSNCPSLDTFGIVRHNLASLFDPSSRGAGFISNGSGKREGFMTNRERDVPPKLVTHFAALLVGSPGQILATVTAEAVERYEKPEFIGCDSDLSWKYDSSWADERNTRWPFSFGWLVAGDWWLVNIPLTNHQSPTTNHHL